MVNALQVHTQIYNKLFVSDSHHAECMLLLKINHTIKTN